MAIKTFAHKGLEELFVAGQSKKLGADVQKRLRSRLDYLDSAVSAEDIGGVHGFHALSGDLAGHYAIKVTANWRLVFRFEHGDKGDIIDVDFVDYH